MEFKKGDKVVVSDYDDDDDDYQSKATYLCFNDINGTDYSHIVVCNGQKEASSWKYCRIARPDLKIDDPVWVRSRDDWLPRHFAEWSKRGKIKCFPIGKTSHSATTENSLEWGEYRLTPPEE